MKEHHEAKAELPDFSIKFLQVIEKLKVVHDWLDYSIGDSKAFESLWGGISLLENIIEDFARINSGLYGPRA